MGSFKSLLTTTPRLSLTSLRSRICPSPVAQQLSPSHLDKRSAWEDLPPEVFEQTLIYMGDLSLLTLAKVNRLFNYMALEKFFGEPMMGKLLEEGRFANLPVNGLGKPDAIEGLRLSVWLERLEHVHHRFTHQGLVRDVKTLTSIVARMPTFKTLHLDLRETKESLYDPNYHIPEQAIARLCDVAIAKGCESLKLGRHGLVEFDHRRQHQQEALFHVVDNYFERANLHVIQICGAFLVFPFLTYTSSLLEARSTTIHHLHFDTSTIFIAAETWENILGSVHFPNLETFLFNHPVMTRIRGTTLVKFLSSHPTIKTLRLYCGSKDPLKGLDQPNLPSLSTIDAEPRLITRLFQSRTVCPNVREVVIRQGTENDRFLDEALGAVNRPDREAPEKIVLKVKLYSRSWLTWMTRHIEDDVEGASSGLRNVSITNLAFCVDSVIRPRMDKEAMRCFAQWVALFPALRHLEIVRPLDRSPVDVDVASREKALHDTVFQYCPKLESFFFTSCDEGDYTI